MNITLEPPDETRGDFRVCSAQSDHRIKDVIEETLRPGRGLEHGMRLVTHNTRHVGAVLGIALENPLTAS